MMIHAGMEGQMMNHEQRIQNEFVWSADKMDGWRDDMSARQGSSFKMTTNSLKPFGLQELQWIVKQHVCFKQRSTGRVSLPKKRMVPVHRTELWTTTITPDYHISKHLNKLFNIRMKNWAGPWNILTETFSNIYRKIKVRLSCRAPVFNNSLTCFLQNSGHSEFDLWLGYIGNEMSNVQTFMFCLVNSCMDLWIMAKNIFLWALTFTHQAPIISSFMQMNVCTFKSSVPALNFRLS